VVLAAFLWGCTGSSAPSPTAPDTTSTTSVAATTTPTPAPASIPTPIDESDVLRMGTTAPIGNLDPADAFTLADWEILHAIGEGLLRLEPASGSLVPGIAEGLPEVSDDGRTYTFRLRSDVMFPDGTTLTAPLYVEGIQRVMGLGGSGSDLISTTPLSSSTCTTTSPSFRHSSREPPIWHSTPTPSRRTSSLRRRSHRCTGPAPGMWRATP
jgi:ABC-type transport system substrate-binding protein